MSGRDEAVRLIGSLKAWGRITQVEADLLIGALEQRAPAPPSDPYLITDFAPDALKAWLARMLDLHDLTASVLAREAGLQPSSLLRFLKGETLAINTSSLDAVIKVLRARPIRRKVILR